MASWTWEFNWWGLLYVFVVLFILSGIVDFGMDDSLGSSQKHRTIVTSIVCTVVFALANVLSYWATGLGDGDRTARYGQPRSQEISRMLGLQSGQPYEVLLGSRIDGAAGNAYFSGGIFGSEARINMQPGSAINVGFNSGSTYYLLQLPIASQGGRGVAFTISDQNRITLNLKDGSVKQSVGSWQVDTPGSKGACSPAIATAVLVQYCAVRPTTYRFVPYDSAATAFSSIIMEHFDGAIVELTPEAYARYVGTP